MWSCVVGDEKGTRAWRDMDVNEFDSCVLMEANGCTLSLSVV